VGAFVLGTLPVSLFFVLNFLRPDLMGPMLDHPAGRTYVPAVASSAGLSLLFYLLAVAGPFRARWPRVLLYVAGGVVTSLAFLVALFGPIVFALLYGDVAR